MKHLLVFSLVAQACFSVPARGQDQSKNESPIWTGHSIDPRTVEDRGADGVRLLDVNGDGLLDVTSGWEEANQVRIYLHPGPVKVKQPWPKVIVGRNVGRPEDAVFCDLDGDGAVDVVSSGEARRIHFHWAPKNKEDYLKESAWVTQVLPSSIKQSGMFVVPLQIDGKNGMDLISGGKGTDLVWFESPEDPRNVEGWKRHTISSTCNDGWTMGLYAADLDRDGDSDVVWTTRMGANGGVRWLENPGRGPAQKQPWAEHKLSEGHQDFMFGDVADVDGDGLLDVVAPVRNADLHFFRNLGDGKWQDVEIQAPGAKKGVAVGDLNLDGRMDLVVTHVGKLGPVWYSHRGDPSDPISWQGNSTDAPGGKSDLVQLYDVDRDGDLDILTTIETTNFQVMWYENPYSKNFPGSVRPTKATSPDTGEADRGIPPVRQRTGRVRVVDHSLVDDQGPFLGLGVSYFTALWRLKHDRERLESDLAFLSRQGFNYYRMLTMVGYYPGWAGKEIAPVDFTNRDDKRIKAWPDYWQQLPGLIDLAYDKYGLRTQITIFADAQLIPSKSARIEHMRKLLADVVPGREHKIILLEVANEAWQNGFPGKEGVTDLREFAKYLNDRTKIPIAISSNHDWPELGSPKAFDLVYKDAAADVATWHFTRDHRTDEGWKPVYDCWDLGDRPGFPPVSSNEPIGPGSSVNTEKEPVRLVMAAAFAYAAKLPMYVFHSEAGVFGKTRFEETPGIQSFRPIMRRLPNDLPNWQRNDGKEENAPFTVFAGGKPNRYWPEVEAAQKGCVRNTGSRKGDEFVCVPIGIRDGGLEVEARDALEFTAYDPLTGKALKSATLRAGERLTLPRGPGALIIRGRNQGKPKSQ